MHIKSWGKVNLMSSDLSLDQQILSALLITLNIVSTCIVFTLSSYLRGRLLTTYIGPDCLTGQNGLDPNHCRQLTH